MNWSLVNDQVVAIGVICSIISLGGLWLYSESFDFCIEGSILSSIKTNSSNNHKTLDADNLWNTIPKCKTETEVNAGFWLILLGIIGNLGNLSNSAINTIKKNRLKKKDILENNSGYTRAPLDISRKTLNPSFVDMAEFDF